jgi:DNA uptake protein ComE-like DNA-binding protein
MRIALSLAMFFTCLLPASAAPKPLVKLEKCIFVETDWADGDSFQIKKSDGKLMTIRLYAVDCLETGDMDATDARRLRDQRRYFGITEVKGDAPDQDPVLFAKGYGSMATRFTADQLKRPFTVLTRMQKALGDGKHERFYAFVETADKKDLATELVRTGLARAYGVSADGPKGRSRERYKEILADIELQAAKRGEGIWGATDWDRLPAERDIQRLEDEEDKIAQGNSPLPTDFRINPNTASRDDLDLLPKIGEALADRIIEAREDAPFQKPEDLMRVPGIKQKTIEGIRQYLDFKVP